MRRNALMVIVLYLQLVHAIMEAHNKKLSVMLKAHVDPVSKYFSLHKNTSISRWRNNIAHITP
jgi:hypothetical protein